MVSRQNDFHDMLKAIQLDIINKHRRRVVRRDELKKIRTTLANLEEKASYLQEQRNAYTDYVNSCMAQLSTKRYIYMLNVYIARERV